MPLLLLLRHAKAHAGGDDFARALSDKGQADAARIGTYLHRQQMVPDLALVSTALRTRQTLEALSATAGHGIAATFEDGLYNATERQLRDRLATIDPAVGTLMLLGHNPGIMELALRLAQSGDLTDFDAMRSRFPPCSLAVIAFDHGTWDDARDGGGRLDAFITPDRSSS